MSDCVEVKWELGVHLQHAEDHPHGRGERALYFLNKRNCAEAVATPSRRHRLSSVCSLQRPQKSHATSVQSLMFQMSAGLAIASSQSEDCSSFPEGMLD